MADWIKTSESLPQELGRYLAFGTCKKTKEKKMQILKYYQTNAGFNVAGSKRWSEDGLMNPSTISHWAELPSIPEE